MMLQGRQIKAARAFLGISQEELAQAVGLSARTINTMETGEPSKKAHDKVMNYLVGRGILFSPGSGGKRLGVSYEPIEQEVGMPPEQPTVPGKSSPVGR
jgi:transcriptional regulator with XRE-family HTH domain